MPEELHNNQKVNSQCWETSEDEGEGKRKKGREGGREGREKAGRRKVFAGLPHLPLLFSLFELLRSNRTRMGYPSEKAPQNTHFHMGSHSPKSSAKAAGTCHYSIVKVVSLQLDTKSLCFVQGVFHRAALFALRFENLSIPSSDLGFEEQRYPLHC